MINSHDILMISTADWDNPFWTNKQLMAAHFAERGYRVLYVESLGLRRATVTGQDFSRIARRILKTFRALRRVRENVWVHSPVVLPGKSAWIKALNQRLLTHRINRCLAKLGMKRPMVWTYNPMVWSWVNMLPRDLLVYHCVDDLSAQPGMPAEAIRQADEEMAVMADVIFTTAPALARRFSQWAPEKTHYFPNVADYEHFSQARQNHPIPDEMVSIPSPRIGFVGAIADYKVDFDLISQVARSRPEWHWIMIGKVGEGQPTTKVDKLNLPNIHLLGPRAYSGLPRYLAHMDVVALPCCLNDYTRSMFPMKFFEYLAAGKMVVATQLEALQEYSQACLLADDAAEFEKHITTVLDGRGPNLALCDTLAQNNTWDTRMEYMLWVLQEGQPDS